MTNVDLDTLTTQQLCFFSSDNQAAHHAPRANGWLWVIPGNYFDWTKQICFAAGTVNASDMYIYTRLKQNGTWGNWYVFTGTSQ